ncbi:PREDICTED: putative defensin-like protein 55 isoform X2 [Camelina sativa]|uniref:Defensin-like protein 55 isoform X2 n=1 Tax=Camelina sativa TaxID=90675 RepID=A0ABM1QGF3_CAMSA|nr:PREDICTED: putative defensin-like protein 55 isoform X2 [Camelina sativa]
MNITKAYVIIFLVVILTNSLSNSNGLASSVIETSKNDVCFVPCTIRYGTFECFHDCILKLYRDGNCVHGRCCCTK